MDDGPSDKQKPLGSPLESADNVVHWAALVHVRATCDSQDWYACVAPKNMVFDEQSCPFKALASALGKQISGLYVAPGQVLVFEVANRVGFSPYILLLNLYSYLHR